MTSYFWRLGITLAALGRSRERIARQRWSRDELLAFQRRQLGKLVEDASRRSAFYRRLYGGPVAASEVELSSLPSVSKANIMSAFDEVVTDPRLRLRDVEAHLSGPSAGGLYLDEYVVIATSGSTGLRGVFLYSRDEWKEAVSALLTFADMMGVRPTLPRQRVAVVAAPSERHISFRLTHSADVGLHSGLRLSATAPIDRLGEELSRHRCHAISAYPSVLAMLAEEQLAGRLRLAPRWLVTHSELRTPEMLARIRAAWGLEPFEGYAMTEAGNVANDCEAHAGMHVIEDGVILESVDTSGRPVPAGTVGARVLLTNLSLRTQPLIRYEVSDLIALDERPCACGRTTKRVVAIDGRADDVLDLPTPGGGILQLHPIHLRSPLGAMSEVGQYQIVQDGPRLTVSVVPRRKGDGAGLDAAVRKTMSSALTAAGVADIPVEVHVVDGLERSGGGKLKLVERKRSEARR